MIMFLAESIGDREQRTVNHGTVVAGQVDQSGLRDETTKFDQLARPLPSVHNPLPHIRSSANRLKPAFRRRLSSRFRHRRQRHSQRRVSVAERMLGHDCASSPSGPNRPPPSSSGARQRALRHRAYRHRSQ